MAFFGLSTQDDNITGTSKADQFAGPAGGTDTLHGAGGNDLFFIDPDEKGTIDGGPGTDELFVFDRLSAGLSVTDVEKLNVAATSLKATVAQLAAFSDINPVSPSSSDFFVTLHGAGGVQDFAANYHSSDTLHVDASTTTSRVSLGGTSHADNIQGSAFDDSLFGVAGDDSINGHAGNDIIAGGPGNDSLDGSSGNDTVTFSGAGRGVIVNLGTGQATGEGTDTLSSFENAIGSAFNDRLIGDANANSLRGEGGNDTITGGGGADKLTGGPGADHFVFNSITDSTVASAGRDSIFDFSHAQGDKIDLHAIDANTAGSGNQAFTFIGTDPFSHHAGELDYSVSGTTSFLHGDVNGDGSADFTIALFHVTSLTAGDIVV